MNTRDITVNYVTLLKMKYIPNTMKLEALNTTVIQIFSEPEYKYN